MQSQMILCWTLIKRALCVYTNTQNCVPCFVVRVWKSQTKCLAGSSVQSKWGWDMVWISCSCWEHHKELISVEMQNTGAGKPSILFPAGIQSLPLWVLIPAVLGMVQAQVGCSGLPTLKYCIGNRCGRWGAERGCVVFRSCWLRTEA